MSLVIISSPNLNSSSVKKADRNAAAMQGIVHYKLEPDAIRSKTTLSAVRSAVRYMIISSEKKDSSSEVISNPLTSQLVVVAIMDAICLLDDMTSVGFDTKWIINFESWHEKTLTLREHEKRQFTTLHRIIYDIIENRAGLDQCSDFYYFNKSGGLDIIDKIKPVTRLLEVLHNLRLRIYSEEKILNETCFELLRLTTKLPQPSSASSRLLSARTAIILLDSVRQRKVGRGFKSVQIQCGGTICKLISVKSLVLILSLLTCY